MSSVISRTRVAFDDEHHRLIINGRVPHLSRMEYRLVRMLYAQFEEYEAGKSESYRVSAEAIAHHIGTRNMQSLYKLVSGARLALEPFLFEINGRWKQGYAIVPPLPNQEGISSS